MEREGSRTLEQCQLSFGSSKHSLKKNAWHEMGQDVAIKVNATGMIFVHTCGLILTQRIHFTEELIEKILVLKSIGYIGFGDETDTAVNQSFDF